MVVAHVFTDMDVITIAELDQLRSAAGDVCPHVDCAREGNRAVAHVEGGGDRAGGVNAHPACGSDEKLVYTGRSERAATAISPDKRAAMHRLGILPGGKTFGTGGEILVSTRYRGILAVVGVVFAPSNSIKRVS